MIAHYIKANGEKAVITPQYGNYFSITELQKYIEGSVEIYITPDQHTMIARENNDNTLLLNHEATKLMGKKQIFGNVIICDWSTAN